MDQPLAPANFICRPDLSLLVCQGDTLIECHFSPEEALELADALASFAWTHLAAAAPGAIARLHEQGLLTDDDIRRIDALRGGALPIAEPEHASPGQERAHGAGDTVQ